MPLLTETLPHQSPVTVTVREHGHGSAHDEPAHDEQALPTNLPRIGWGVVLLMAALFLGVLGGLFYLGWKPRQAREAQLLEDLPEAFTGPPIVDVVTPKRSAAAMDVILPADVRPMQDTAIYPRANGYLKRFLVDIGDAVQAGQLLAEIDTPEVDADLNQARAALEQARANANKARADMELAQVTLGRYEKMAREKVITPQDLDEKSSAYNQSSAACAAAEASAKAAQATVERLSTLQGFEKVTAPFSGVITARNYDAGALLSASNVGSAREMFHIEQNDTLRVFINVPQSYVNMVKIGQPAQLTVRNFPGRAFEGKVVRFADALDPNTRTLRYEVDVANAEHLLHSGMYGQVKLQARQGQPPLTIPTSALLVEAAGTRVAVVESGKVKMKKVSAGRDFGAEIEIIQGLAGNEQVVVTPDERVVEGAEVRIAH